MPFSRRDILTMGCSAAAAPFITPVTLAAAPWDQRLVVIILRGAMDGLDVVRPVGDPHFTAARRSLNEGDQGHDLDGFFALHPDLDGLMPLWRAGQLGFVHAVSTPYRDKRSHFDGQDLLEAGTGFEGGTSTIRDGWLNRMLQTLPGITAETAYAVGPGGMLLTSGAVPVASWSPDADLDLSPQARDLMKLVARADPLFSGAVEGAIDIVESLEAEAGMVGGARGQKPHVAIA
ncbi:twin-arginine translocation pathway signal, partial [Escherichia coli]|nr:twin-arginine translocation pathway signal [Escherichia coli]